MFECLIHIHTTCQSNNGEQEETHRKLLIINKKSIYKSYSNEKWDLLLTTQNVEDQQQQITVALLDEPFQMKMYSPKS